MRLGTPALIGPQPSETRGRAQLERFGALPASDLKRPMEARLGLGPILGRPGEQQFALEAVEIGLPPALATLVREGEGLGDSVLAGIEPTPPSTDLGQEREVVRPTYIEPGRPQGRQALLDRGSPQLKIALGRL